MTDTEQNIAVAEACGWEIKPLAENGPLVWWLRDEPKYYGDDPPIDYGTDLNAMHEAEKVLTVAQRVTYKYQIGVVMSGGSVGRAIPDWWLIHEATAAQRREAFLRAIGKWKE